MGVEEIKLNRRSVEEFTAHIANNIYDMGVRGDTVESAVQHLRAASGSETQ
jgi:hypothetical protein